MPAKPAPKRLKVGPLDPAIGRTVRALMRSTGTPAVAVGIWHRGRAQAGGFGITSVAAPNPVDAETLFQIGSTTKTFTATAIMRFVDRGAIDLDAPARIYLRGLRLKDPDVTRKVTVRHLLTHMGGWVGDYFPEAGRGDDALGKVIEQLRTLPQLTPLGSIWHYNNAGFYMAGRILERVAGKPYETVIREELLEPLGMTRSFFFADEAIVYRVAAGHVGSWTSTKHTVAQPWGLDRSVNPAGGLISDVVDQLRWAQFHLGDGRTPDGTRLLKKSSMREMQRAQTPPGDFVDATGISFLMENIGDVRAVGHGGTTNGHLSAFTMVPERDFAITVLTNSTRGGQVHRKIVERALDHFLGVKRTKLRPSTNGFDLQRFEGRYVSGLKEVEIDLSVRGRGLRATFGLVGSDADPGIPPFKLALADEGKAVIQGGRLDGLKAEFLRDERGRIRFIRLGGRLYKRTAKR